MHRKVIVQNGKFYGRFPGDAQQMRRVVRFLIGQPEGGVKTPSGNFLTPRGLQSLGCQGGKAWHDAAGKSCSRSTFWLIRSSRPRGMNW